MVADNSNPDPAIPATFGVTTAPPNKAQDPGIPPSAPSAQYPALSSLSPHDTSLLNALLASNFDLPRTAADHGLSTIELMTWLNTPLIQHAAATLLTTSQTFLEIKLTRARMAVIDTLQEIALHHESLTERRRAATALCRRFGYGSLLDRTGVRRIGNPPPFTDYAPSPIPAGRVATCSEAAQEVPSPIPDGGGAAGFDAAEGVPAPTPAAPLPTQDPGPQDSGLPQSSALSPQSCPLLPDGDEAGFSAVLPWPMPETPDPDPPTRLAGLLFHAFMSRDLPRLAATFFHHATTDATLDNRPLREALPNHILAVMYRSREVAYVERSRSPNEATYTFSFERAPLTPSRATFRFHLTRAHAHTWLIHQIDTLDTS